MATQTRDAILVAMANARVSHTWTQQARAIAERVASQMESDEIPEDLCDHDRYTVDIQSGTIVCKDCKTSIDASIVSVKRHEMCHAMLTAMTAHNDGWVCNLCGAIIAYDEGDDHAHGHIACPESMSIQVYSCYSLECSSSCERRFRFDRTHYVCQKCGYIVHSCVGCTNEHAEMHIASERALAFVETMRASKVSIPVQSIADIARAVAENYTTCDCWALNVSYPVNTILHGVQYVKTDTRCAGGVHHKHCKCETQVFA